MERHDPFTQFTQGTIRDILECGASTTEGARGGGGVGGGIKGEVELGGDRHKGEAILGEGGGGDDGSYKDRPITQSLNIFAYPTYTQIVHDRSQVKPDSLDAVSVCVCTMQVL